MNDFNLFQEQTESEKTNQSKRPIKALQFHETISIPILCTS